MNIANWREVEPGIYSSGQPGPLDWRRIAEAGVAAVVNLRPDAEQPGVDEQSAVRALGLAYHAFPIASAADLDAETVSRFSALMAQLRGRPALVHCGSGNRVGALFALSRAREAGVSAREALAYGRSAGLAGLEPQIARMLGAG